MRFKPIITIRNINRPIEVLLLLVSYYFMTIQLILAVPDMQIE